MISIDLNCDMGESWYDHIVGQDEAIFPLITSCNLACGEHGGDPETTDRAVRSALAHHVKIGAHPSLPNLQNFGREAVNLSEKDLSELLRRQLKHLLRVTDQHGAVIHHLKPHGALYHLATKGEKEAAAIIQTALEFGIPKIYGTPGSRFEEDVKAAGLDFIAEGFIDRVYENGTQLRSRKLPEATIRDPEQAAQQAYDLAVNGMVTDHYGRQHSLKVQTLCIHGDHPEALDNLRAVRKRLALL